MVSRLLTISRALKTPLVMLAAAILGLAVPGSTAQAQCGGENQRPCGILERIPSCNTGMKEDFGKGKCVKMATPCGAAGQRPCQIVERALSCNPGSYEDVGQKLCVQKTPCGAVDQRPCRIDERIPSCDKGLYEDLGKAKCFVHGDFLRDGNAKCVHVPGVSHANGVQLRTWDCVNMAHLTWEKVPGRLDIYTDQEAGFQFFWLKNRLTGKCAAVHAGQKQDGSQVIQWDCGNGKHFQWAWDVNGRLRNRESLKCVNSESGSQNAPLTIVECPRIEVPNEAQWTFDKPPEKTGIADYSPENTPTVLKNGFGRCLQVPQGNNADGVQLSTWECNAATASIRWVQEKGITVDRAYFWFKNRMTGGCLAVQSGAKNDGAPVVQLQCGGEPQGENFHWKWTAGKQLVNRESGKCLQASSLEPATIKQCIQLAVSTNNLWSFVKPGGETYR